MIIVLSLLLVIVFLVLSGIHFYWALGGTWGFNKVLPTNNEGIRMLNPTKFDSAMVAVGLLLFATYYLLIGNIISLSVPSYILTYAGSAIAGIFILRAVGDFKYVGFFKRVKSTEFANIDSKYYSPLCLVLGIIGIAIELYA